MTKVTTRPAPAATPATAPAADPAFLQFKKLLGKKVPLRRREQFEPGDRLQVVHGPESGRIVIVVRVGYNPDHPKLQAWVGVKAVKGRLTMNIHLHPLTGEVIACSPRLSEAALFAHSSNLRRIKAGD